MISKKEDSKTLDLEFKDKRKNRNQETRIIVNYAKHMLPVVITTKNEALYVNFPFRHILLILKQIKVSRSYSSCFILLILL